MTRAIIGFLFFLFVGAAVIAWVALRPLLFSRRVERALQQFVKNRETLQREFFQAAAAGTSGAVVAGATVTATNVGTNVSRETTTSPSGTFSFPNVLPGTYTVTVDSGGFQKYTRELVQVRTNQATEVNAPQSPV